MTGNGLPGKLLTGITLPERWERAYGYPGRGRFIAVWWRPNGGAPAEAMVDDGFCRAAVAGWPYFIDLAGLLIRGGYARERLAYYAQPPTHCALLDLEQRTVHHAPLDEALAWLRERATPGADELPEPAVPEDLAALRQTLSDLISATTGERRERLQNGGHLCPRCGGYGWLRERRERDNGRTASAYAICEACGGEGVVESEERR
jgi:hypothetical protein